MSKVVMQARAKELRFELLNSKRLQAHFEEHPADLALLKHDKPLAKTAAAPHLKQLPGYLRNAAGIAQASYSGNRGRGAHILPACHGYFAIVKRQPATARTPQMPDY